jgi:hypothetical protein
MGGKDSFPIPNFCPQIFLVPILDLDSPKSGQGKLEGKIFDHSKKFYCGNVRRGAVLKFPPNLTILQKVIFPRWGYLS